MVHGEPSSELPTRRILQQKKYIPWCSKKFLDERCINPRDFARIYFDDCFVINNVTVIQGKDNAFVSMPSYKTKEVDENNKPVYRDICYPVTKEFREKLYGTILEMHQQEREKHLQEGRPLNRRERMQTEIKGQEEKEEKEQKEQKPKKSRGK